MCTRYMTRSGALEWDSYPNWSGTLASYRSDGGDDARSDAFLLLVTLDGCSRAGVVANLSREVGARYRGVLSGRQRRYRRADRRAEAHWRARPAIRSRESSRRR